jgi:hypothetical protein
MAPLRYDHVARLQYFLNVVASALKLGKQRRSQDPPIVGRRLSGSLVRDALKKAASVLDDPFQHITKRNPSRRVFGAFGLPRWDCAALADAPRTHEPPCRTRHRRHRR